jgi:hypothetical protein
MAAIDFPNSPEVDDLFTQGDITWQWDGTVWRGLGTTATGPAGVAISDDEPESNQVLWLDTDEEPDVPVPAGGSAGQLLAKVDSTDYNTQWKTSDGVRSFANSAARGSAIPSPTLGMYTHLEDAPARTEFWNGSAWVSPSGLTLIGDFPFTSSTLVRINSVFTAKYDNYLVRVQVNSSTANSVLTGRYLTAVDTQTTTSSYFRRGFFSSISTLSNYAGDSETSYLAGVVQSSSSSSELWISNPFNATRTIQRAQIVDNADLVLYSTAIIENTTRSFTGLQIVPNTGSITGTVKVYGYRNA